MLDLNEQPKLPPFELKLFDNEVKSYDTLLVSYKLRALDVEKDPVRIQEIVNKTFEIDVDAWTAMLILEKFTKFAGENLEGPLKKVFGLEPYSATSTDSRPPNSKPSDQQNTSD